MKLLLDANVLIDFVAEREPSVSDVRKLCIAATFGDVQLWVSTQSYADAYYVLRKYVAEKDVKEVLLASLEFFIPCGTHAADLRPALESDWSDVEDYMIAYSAKRMGAACLITRDEEIARRSPVPAYTASEFLDYLKTDHGLAYDDIEL